MLNMESRKKERFSDAAGDLYKEVCQINLLEEEKGYPEESLSLCAITCSIG